MSDRNATKLLPQPSINTADRLVKIPSYPPARTNLDHALEYASWGWHVFPLRGWKDGPDGPVCDCSAATCKPGKHPRCGRDQHGGRPWGASDDPHILRELFTNPDDGIGLACGPSGIVGFDIDGAQGRESWAAIVGDRAVPETLESVTGREGGGQHIYFRATDIRMLNGAWSGIDVKGIGGMLVLPPTRHKSGSRYRYVNDHDIAELPDFLRNALAAKGLVGPKQYPAAEPFEGREATAAEQSSARGLLEHHTVIIGEREYPGPIYGPLNKASFECGKFVPHCISEDEVADALIDALRVMDPTDIHLAKNAGVIRNGLRDGQRKREWPRDRNVRLDAAPKAEVVLTHSDRVKTSADVLSLSRSAAAPGEVQNLLRAIGKGEPQACAYHEADPRRAALMIETANFIARRWPHVDVDHLDTLFAQSHCRDLTPHVREAVSTWSDPEPWRGKVVCAKEGGAPKSCTANAVIILREHGPVEGLFAHDRFAGETFFTRDAPWGTKRGTKVEDPDVTAAVAWLGETTRVSFEPHMLHGAIESVARDNGYDPLTDYLDGLAWDGVPRVDSWLTRYAGAESTPFVRAAGRAWLISAVARAYLPGCKADHVLILEGKQGIGKSSLLQALTGEAWFTDKLGNLDGKEAAENLQSKWIVEIAELAALRGRESTATKSFLSRCSDRYRQSYGRVSADRPRRCVFAGSTNDHEYLEDGTGGRRYWPVACGECDVVGIARDRDQIWAEVVSLFRAGEQWWLTPEIEKRAREAQAERDVADPWEGVLADALATRTEPLSMSDALTLVGVPMAQQGVGGSRRAGAVLRRLGWEKTRTPGARTKLWVRA